METTKQPGDASEEARRLRRIARDAKRERQRLASFERAARMRQERLRQGAREKAEPAALVPQKYHVGCSGWFYWHWRGSFYPEDIPRTDWFRHYAENFDTVELNAPFYSWPTSATVKTWIRQAEGFDKFVYTVKVSELITPRQQIFRHPRPTVGFWIHCGSVGAAIWMLPFPAPA